MLHTLRELVNVNQAVQMTVDWNDGWKILELLFFYRMNWDETFSSRISHGDKVVAGILWYLQYQ